MTQEKEGVSSIEKAEEGKTKENNKGKTGEAEEGEDEEGETMGHKKKDTEKKTKPGSPRSYVEDIT